jgi:ribosomal protein S18 acetylase RimI-like enzyme
MTIVFRYDVEERDCQEVRRLVDATGYFSAAEADVAVELVQERLAKGDASGYHFVFVEEGRAPAGYGCYGPIPGTESSFDLYWIVVDPSRRGKGLGRALMTNMERLVQERGGRRIYVDTSSRPQYASTRAFYEHNGYVQAALLEDFYAPGDGKAIYLKVLCGV